MDTTNHYTLPALPSTIRRLTTEESTRLGHIFPGLPTVAGCITCQGEKVFRWYRHGSREAADVVTYRCPCADQFILHRRLLHSGIHETFQRLSWADFVDLPDEAIVGATEYLDHAKQFVAAGLGMILVGDKGNGKTLLSNLIVKELTVKGFDCYANTFSTMIDTFAAGWADKDDRRWFDRRIRNADVLLIDDLGRERNKGVGTVGEQALEEVVRHRVSRSKPTLITSNKTISEIEGGYGGNTMSLLKEKSCTYRFTGPDRREEVNARTKMEILSGLTRPVVLT